VHIDDNQSIDSDDLILSQFLSHQHHSLNQLLILSIQIILYSLSTISLDGTFDFCSPVDLAAVEDALSRMADDPIISWALFVIYN